MKTTKKWNRLFLLGMSALVLAFGLAVIGCADGSGGGGTEGGDDILAGTWVGTTYGDGPLTVGSSPNNLRIVAANGLFKAYVTCTYPDLTDEECGQGRYTVSGTSVTITITKTLYVWWDSYGTVTDSEWRATNQSQTVTIIGDTVSFLGSTFTKLVPVTTPTASPVAGAVAAGTLVTLTTTTTEADIYYTTNGSTPTTSSAKYSAPIPVNVALTIKAIAVKSGMTDSGVLSATYTMAPTGTATVIYVWVDEHEIATSATTATLSRVANQSLTITVTASGYSDYRWSYNGSNITGTTGTASSYTFTSAGKGNGKYNIGLRVKKDNAWYSTQITITVTD